MANKQQTSVEWLVENSEYFFGNLLAPSIIHQALQMEREQKREQIYKAFDAGSAYAIGSHADFKQTHPNKEQYYEQTYGTEQSH